MTTNQTRTYDSLTAKTLIADLSSSLAAAEGWLLGAIKVESERGAAARDAERNLKDEVSILVGELAQQEPISSIPKSTKAFDLAIEAERAKLNRDPRLQALIAEVRDTHRSWLQASAELERSKTSFAAIKIRSEMVTAGLRLQD